MAVEIKPSVGDDYPSVMRQMKRLGAKVLVVGAWTGRGVSEPQMRAMFKAGGIKRRFPPGDRGTDARAMTKLTRLTFDTRQRR